MSRLARSVLIPLTAVSVVLMIFMAATADTAAAQRRGSRQAPPHDTVARRPPARPHPVHSPAVPAIRGHVFIGGYFYDPFFGPYPWWNRGVYPHWYAPVFDLRADVRVRVMPKEAKEAAVYVDGFYAGVVDDFDGTFQSLPLPPGGHVIVLYLDGYRTVRRNLYLARGSSYTIRENLVRLGPGETSEAPEVAPAVPPPPPGSYRVPGSAPGPTVPPSRAAVGQAEGYGTLDLYVQPENADVTIDGERWVSSEDGHYVLQLPVGPHRLEITRRGYRTYSTTVDVGAGEPVPLNVGLTAMTT